MKHTAQYDKCLNPNCKRAALTRGLCANCYQAAIRFIKTGVSTWAKLEKEGKAKPKKLKWSSKHLWLSE